jgi:DNA-binding IclR family transcriptional regulator
MKQAELVTEINQAFNATQTLSGWIAGAKALSLLQLASSTGILEVTAKSVTLAEIQRKTKNSNPELVENICQALEAHGVLEREGERYRLSPDFALLASNNKSLQSLSALIEGGG